MYRMNSSVELFQLGKSTCLGNFDSGAIIFLNDMLLDIIKDFSEGKTFTDSDFKEQPELLQELKNGGYFEQYEEPLGSCYLHVTNICNLNCIGCYSYDRTRNCKDVLSLEQIKNILDQLRYNGAEVVTISGGEPLIRQDIGEIVRYAKEDAGFDIVNLITNGTIHDKEKLMSIKYYVDALAVSIDGYNEQNPKFLRDDGTFPKVIEFVKYAKEFGFPVSILPTLHDKNIDYINEYMKLSHELKVPISFSLLTCSGELSDYIPTEEKLISIFEFLTNVVAKGEAGLEDYNDIEARKNCGAGKNIISIAADGTIYPCHMMHDTDTSMGNILEESLSNILKKTSEIPDVDAVSECKDCSVKNICGGGCKARALLINKDLKQPDPYCGLNKRFFLKYMNTKEKYGEYKSM